MIISRLRTLSVGITGLLVGVSIAAAVGKTEVRASGSQAAQTERYENLELFQKVLHFVESNYVEEVKNKDLIYGAIKGMLETLDPHSNFLPPEVFKDMKMDTSGKFGGLGIEIGMKDNILTVIAPIEDTPAWKAGLKPGDRIVKINGESTKGLNLVEAVAKMRGKQGQSVKLGIYRKGFASVQEYVVKRELIKIQSVKSEVLESQYGWVRLTNFNENAATDIKKAIEQLEKKAKLKGIVLDLRSNPGGLLDQAVEVASLFIDEGVIVSTIGRNKDQKEIKYARKGVARKDLAVAILVNSSTASAAEIVAGAMQDHHRGIVMGMPTFGKGSVQSVIELGQDMGLKLTIARYFTPSGRSIQEKGVIPDIQIDDFDPKLLASARLKSESLRERDLKGHFTNGDSDSEDGEDHAVEVSGSGGQRSDFSREELEGDSSRATTQTGEGAPVKYSPKEDFQVKEAVNYLKSYEFFKKMTSAESGGIKQ